MPYLCQYWCVFKNIKSPRWNIEEKKINWGKDRRWQSSWSCWESKTRNIPNTCNIFSYKVLFLNILVHGNNFGVCNFYRIHLWFEWRVINFWINLFIYQIIIMEIYFLCNYTNFKIVRFFADSNSILQIL